MNERVGAWSVIDRLTISEASRNAQIEAVRDVGRVLAAVRPASVSALDYNSTLNNKSLASTRQYITGNLLNQVGGLDVSLRLADLSGFLDHGPGYSSEPDPPEYQFPIGAGCPGPAGRG